MEYYFTEAAGPKFENLLKLTSSVVFSSKFYRTPAKVCFEKLPHWELEQPLSLLKLYGYTIFIFMDLALLLADDFWFHKDLNSC